MKLVVWIVFGLFALAWTTGALLTAEVVEWAASALASGEAANLAAAASRAPLPAWLALWVDPAWLQAVQATVHWALDALGDLLPLIGSAVPWLVAGIWLIWGLGLAVLFVLALGAHLLVTRFAARQQQPRRYA